MVRMARRVGKCSEVVGIARARKGSRESGEKSKLAKAALSRFNPLVYHPLPPANEPATSQIDQNATRTVVRGGDLAGDNAHAYCREPICPRVHRSWLIARTRAQPFPDHCVKCI